MKKTKPLESLGREGYYTVPPVQGLYGVTGRINTMPGLQYNGQYDIVQTTHLTEMKKFIHELNADPEFCKKFLQSYPSQFKYSFINYIKNLDENELEEIRTFVDAFIKDSMNNILGMLEGLGFKYSFIKELAKHKDLIKNPYSASFEEELTKSKENNPMQDLTFNPNNINPNNFGL